MSLQWHEFASKDELDLNLAHYIAAQLQQAIAERGTASLAVSGGRTPAGMFKALRSSNIEWAKVNITLVDERWVLRNEPIARGGGKPHICEELVRQGGQLVYVSSQHPNGLTEGQRGRLISRKPELRHLHWVAQRRNPSVFVRGRVRHPDHKTIILNGWHQVMMNTENESLAMRHVAFID